MTEFLERRLADAQAKLTELGGSSSELWGAAFDELRAAQQSLAAARGDQYAVTVDGGPLWDVGAPLPHLIANGASVYIVCRADDSDPGWDGTYVTGVSSGDTYPTALLVIEPKQCIEVRMGGPSDTAFDDHPLASKGLVRYQLNEVLNSEWIEHVIRAHPSHADEIRSNVHHYVLPFHDDMVELLAVSIDTTVVKGTLRGVLTDLSERLTSDRRDPGNESGDVPDMASARLRGARFAWACLAALGLLILVVTAVEVFT
ncbi:MAG: hypothetical protein QOK42_2735 [Frankiaceae bacterium]|nr:hypothetical protein [Frankiaceae bacterium]